MITLGELSAVLSIVAFMPYIWQIFFKDVKPERATWFVWTILGLISYFGQKSAGGGDSLWLTAGQVIAVGSVFAVSIFKGVGGLTAFDIKCLALAVVGVVVWQFSKEPSVAIAGAIFADAIAALPTVRKALLEPESESRFAFAVCLIAEALGIVAVRKLDIVLLAWPVYLALNSIAIIGAVAIGYKRKEIHA